MLLQCLTILAANFIAVWYGIKKIIYISHKKHLFDEPSEIRKIHVTKTPNLGGVSIFASIFLTICLLSPVYQVPHVNVLVAASIILFGLGLTDDLVGMDPAKKIIAELVIAFLITVLADIRLDKGAASLFGVAHIPYWISICLSIVFILFVMNAINLIDGVNCLAGSLGLLASSFFSIVFWKLGNEFLLQLSVGLSGCLVAFLFFNKTPAKIFMGDTGSLFLGFIIAILCIKAVESNVQLLLFGTQFSFSSPSIILALLSIPVFDTIRVFAFRLLNKKSPFEADRSHIHHLLLDAGYSHMQTTGILVTTNIVILIFAATLNNLNSFISMGILVVFTAALYQLFRYTTYPRTGNEKGKKDIKAITRHRKLENPFPFKSGKFSTGKEPSFADDPTT